MLVNADLPELKYADLQYLDQKLGYDMSEHEEVRRGLPFYNSCNIKDDSNVSALLICQVSLF